jgi:DNA end-binding protein Ku
MGARAMWKGVVRLADARIPIKLYAAVEDQDVHFRLLHGADRSPIKQVLVDRATDRAVPYRDVKRAFQSAGELVLLRDDELESLEPPASRDIDILQLLPEGALDHRWYVRPYYLGPDEAGTEGYLALAEALAAGGHEALTRWTMRKKEYVGALRSHLGYLVLIALRHAEEVVSVADLGVSPGAQLDERELEMARRLVDMLAGDFRPEEYADEYRARLRELIWRKARGEVVEIGPRLRRREAEPDLTAALEASLEQERKRA